MAIESLAHMSWATRRPKCLSFISLCVPVVMMLPVNLPTQWLWRTDLMKRQIHLSQYLESQTPGFCSTHPKLISSMLIPRTVAEDMFPSSSSLFLQTIFV